MIEEQLLSAQCCRVHLLQVAKCFGIETADGKNLRAADGELCHVAGIPPLPRQGESAVGIHHCRVEFKYFVFTEDVLREFHHAVAVAFCSQLLLQGSNSFFLLADVVAFFANHLIEFAKQLAVIGTAISCLEKEGKYE